MIGENKTKQSKKNPRLGVQRRAGHGGSYELCSVCSFSQKPGKGFKQRSSLGKCAMTLKVLQMCMVSKCKGERVRHCPGARDLGFLS